MIRGVFHLVIGGDPDIGGCDFGEGVGGHGGHLLVGSVKICTGVIHYPVDPFFDTSLIASFIAIRVYVREKAI